MALEVHPLSPLLGAEIRGIDLAAPVGDGHAARLRRALVERRALLFRGQALSAERQVEVAALFGPVETVRSADEGAAGAPRIRYVANREVEGRPGILPSGAMQFHIDYCFHERPYKAVMLYALEAPSRGGATLLADAQAAYEALPEATKARLARLEALHAYRYGSTDRRPVTADMPQHVHPIVVSHPETGRPTLFVNRLMTDHVVGLPRAESNALLAELFDHLEQPRFVIAHKWQAGDLLIWDNLCTLHGRSDFDPEEPRVLRRLTLQGGPTSAAAQPTA